MIQTLATSYFELFPGDFLVIGIVGFIVWRARKKADEDFYE
jgi:hypothetical protein